MKTVFILGAGASFEAGAPLMADFYSRAKELHRQKMFGDASAEIQDVIDAATKDLRTIYAKSGLDRRNIEELFSAIDIGNVIGIFGNRSPDQIAKLRKSIVVFIHRTIEETVRIPFRNGKFGAPKGYEALSELVLKSVRKTAGSGLVDVSFITFNYDTCLEYSLCQRGLGIDYGLRESLAERREDNHQFSVPVFKLHGSINWATCSRCSAIVPTQIDPWFGLNLVNIGDQPSELQLSYFRNFGKYSHQCKSSDNTGGPAPLDTAPYIVPPTWNKPASATGGLNDVWRRAAKEIGTAEQIIVIGYSMPPTDTFFKYLFALGSDTAVDIENFVVVNGTNGSDSHARFKALLSDPENQGFRPYNFVFSGAGNVMRQLLDVD